MLLLLLRFGGLARHLPPADCALPVGRGFPADSASK